MNQPKQIKIHKIDAQGQILGRLAVKVAVLLRGKGKRDFVYNQNLGDKVEVYNLDKIKVSGKKMDNKLYFWHSNYPGGIKQATLGEMLKKDSTWVFRKAVERMLPDNKLRKIWLSNLKLNKLPQDSKERNG